MHVRRFIALGQHESACVAGKTQRDLAIGSTHAPRVLHDSLGLASTADLRSRPARLGLTRCWGSTLSDKTCGASRGVSRQQPTPTDWPGFAVGPCRLRGARIDPHAALQYLPQHCVIIDANANPRCLRLRALCLQPFAQMFTKIVAHIVPDSAHLARRSQHPRMISVAEDSTLSVTQRIDCFGHSNGYATHGATHRLTVGCVHYQMQMIILHRELTQ